MKFIHSALLLGVVSGLCEAGILPRYPVTPTPQPGPQCSPVTVFNTITVTKVIETAPPTITILQQDPQSIIKTLASIDTDQVIEQSELLPISDIPDPNPTRFTHSISVSGYVATEMTGEGASVFYMSKGPSTTDWSYTPAATILAEVTTVTVLPIAQPTTHNREAQTNTTVHPPFTKPSGGWNGTNSNSSIWAAGTGTAVSGFSLAPTSTLTVTSFVFTVTQSLTVSVTPAPTYGYIPPAYGYSVADSPADYGYESPASSVDYGDLEKRQTCVWITATIGGQQVGWCNNWDGASTLTFTSWETTTTPTFIPGIGTVATPSTTTRESSTGSQTKTSFSAIPTTCGQVGPFQIGFDDLPVFSVTNNDTADFPPLFNPYDHFFWGEGWSYVPPPTEPYPPQAGSRLAEFVPSLANNDTGSPDAGLIPPSSFGCGPRAYDDRYWFTAYSAYVGCDNGATNWSLTCDFVATAYQWDNFTQSEVVVATQHFSIPPCPNFKNCQLTKITFNYLFYKMTTLSFYANVQGNLSIFWLDSLDMNWYNNTCTAGLARISSRKI